MRNIDPETLAEWFSAADRGDPEAQYLIASCYLTGERVHRDSRMATQWFTKAAERGHVLAQRQLGTLLWKGIGIEQNQREAARWWSAAARNGDVLAQYLTGTILIRGELLPRDLRTGWRYLYAAAKDAEVWEFVSHQPGYGLGALRLSRRFVVLAVLVTLAVIAVHLLVR